MVKKLRIFWKQNRAKKPVMGAVIIFVMFLIVAFSSMIVLLPEPVRADTGDFTYHKQITIESDYVDQTLTNFPILIHDNTGDLLGNVLTNASDIAFYDITNTTQYNHEVEEYNSTTGELTAWVNITSLSSATDTVLYMYYGDSDGGRPIGYNPAEVWDQHFGLVTHMNGTTALYDSTGGGNAGTKVNTPLEVPGKIAQCQEYSNADGDHFTFTNSTGVDIGVGDATFEAWVTIDIASEGVGYQLWCTEEGDVKINLWYTTNDNPNHRIDPFIRGPANDRSTVRNYTNVTGLGWRYLVIQIDNSEHGTGNELPMYWNATRLGIDDSGLDWPGDSLTTSTIKALGDSSGGSYAWEGYIDEFRLSQTLRSTGWINVSFHSGNQTSGFITLGSQQGGADASSFSLVGLPNSRVTWAGTAGTSVWCNATGDANEVMEINMTVNSSDNVTEVRVFMDDLNDTSEWVNASNITLYISSDNSSYASMGAFTDGGSNISINKSTWPVGGGTNIFDGTGVTDKNVSIFCKFYLSIPSSASTDIFWTSSSTSNKVYLGHYT